MSKIVSSKYYDNFGGSLRGFHSSMIHCDDIEKEPTEAEKKASKAWIQKGIEDFEAQMKAQKELVVISPDEVYCPNFDETNKNIPCIN